MRLLFKVCLDRDCARIHILCDKHLLKRHWVSRDEAWAEVHNILTELDARFSRASCKNKVVLWSTDDLHLNLVSLKLVFADRHVGNFKLLLISLRHAACFRIYGNIFVYLAFPDKVKVKLSIVLYQNFLNLAFIDEEFPELKSMGISWLHFRSLRTCEHRVVDFVSFSFHI